MILSHHSRRAERLLVPAAFATALSNNVQLIVGALLVIREQQTMVAVGWLFIAVAGPQALLSPFFGRLADRFDRRTLWVGCDVVSAFTELLRWVWDLNPRRHRCLDGFQDRSLRPLGQPTPRRRWWPRATRGTA